MRTPVTTFGLRSLVAIAAIGGAVALCNTAAFAQQKSARQCAAEWRANKADNQAKGILEKDYVAQCRAGATTAQPATAPAAAPAPTTTTTTAQKSARQCAAEWRANKADNQAKGILEKDYVAQCRAGATTAQPATGPAPAPAPTATTTTAPRPRETTAAAPAGHFANEALAKARCPTDTVVWVNDKTKVYHFAGHRDYGNTKEGMYMCEKDAIAAGDRSAKNEKHP
jgi:hypothetical protein